METRSSSEGSLSSSVTDDTEGKSNHVLLEELAADYSRLLNFNVAKEQGKFAESIEAMLTKLEEFCGLVDMIRSDTSLCLSKTMPEIQSKCQKMEDMFQRIDRLEAFVAVVKKDVSAMEECVTKAENDLSSGTLIRRLSSLVSSKKASSGAPKAQYAPPPIFRTERYLDSSASGESGHAASVSSGGGSGSSAPSSAAATSDALSAAVASSPQAADAVPETT
ncbi:biogenesis of lysosome-related organelles complex 1 subunit 4-like [Babylonia areolata]|uniref:biogenesis of lysosome-related organelles complex 1 subunit 4-like n=1 Tax=Babylonia areolata TaxID=304850 RepID=UPI003FD30B44